jgi:acylphosphatase
MNKCLKITFIADLPENFLRDFVQKYAKKHGIEGTVQVAGDDSIRIIACGKKEHVESFLDDIHKGTAEVQFEDLIVEPFLKDRDYRGVFRVIE